MREVRIGRAGSRLSVLGVDLGVLCLKKDPRTSKRKKLGTFKTVRAAKHERAVQFFKRH